jgi:hypothetical protein
MLPLDSLEDLLRDSEVSGPERVNGEDISRVSVYGGPYDPKSSGAVLLFKEVFHDSSFGLFMSTCALWKRRSKFCPGALAA